MEEKCSKYEWGHYWTTKFSSNFKVVTRANRSIDCAVDGRKLHFGIVVVGQGRAGELGLGFLTVTTPERIEKENYTYLGIFWWRTSQPIIWMNLRWKNGWKVAATTCILLSLLNVTICIAWHTAVSQLNATTVFLQYICDSNTNITLTYWIIAVKFDAKHLVVDPKLCKNIT